MRAQIFLPPKEVHFKESEKYSEQDIRNAVYKIKEIHIKLDGLLSFPKQVSAEALNAGAKFLAP